MTNEQKIEKLEGFFDELIQAMFELEKSHNIQIQKINELTSNYNNVVKILNDKFSHNASEIAPPTFN